MTRLIKLDRERLDIIDLDGTTHYVQRSGLLFAYAGSVPITVHNDAMRIPDFGRNLKRPAEIMRRVVGCGSAYETRFDAAHGRRYMLCVYGGEPFKRSRAVQRRITLAAADGIRDLLQHEIDAGCTAEEIAAMMEKENREGTA